MTSLHLSRPHAIMMVGTPGSGKSFFAKQFADTFNAPYVDALTLTSYAKDVPSAMKLVTAFAHQIIRTGQTFVYEGDTDTPALRAEFTQFASKNGYKAVLVWVQVDEKTAKDRTVKAGKMDADTFNEVIAGFVAPKPAEKPIVISGKHTYATQAKAVLSHLSHSARPVAATPLAPERKLQPLERRAISVRS